jgi:thiamine pyrophosphokinase
LLGAIGSRFDHSYANVLLLVRAFERNAKAFIIDNKNILFVANSSVLFNGKPGDFVSILPLKEGTAATASYGLKYPLNDLSLPLNRPVGVSNEMTERTAGVTIKSGLALIVLSKD